MRYTSKRLVSLLLLVLPCSLSLADTLETVTSRGLLKCGVSAQVPGFSFQDANGQWSGMDVDFCSAVAAAALGSKDRVEFVPVTIQEGIKALGNGEIDLLSRNLTWTMERDVGAGISFVGTLYFDGQGFLIPRDSGIVSALELSEKSVCVVSDTTHADQVKRYFDRHRMTLTLRTFETNQAAHQAYLEGECEVLTSDHSQLHGLRATIANGGEHRILPEVISKEPLSPAVREGHPRWFDIVRWTLFTLINAEELGIDSRNLNQAERLATAPDTRLLLDLEGEVARHLGLDPGWTSRVIGQVGNYAEIFARHLGEQSPLKIKRGLNALWSDGGLLYAPPPR